MNVSRETITHNINVLIACEESQTVCKAFWRKGFNAFSCDVLKPSGRLIERHILCDVLSVINGGYFRTMNDTLHYVSKWDLIIAHPPCTYLSRAGACRLYPKKGILDYNRYVKGLQAKEFFLNMLYAKCDHIAVENPVPLRIFELPPHTQTIQPFEYGHPYSKKTLLWLKGLPLLQPTEIIKNYEPYLPSCTSVFKGEHHRGTVHGQRQRAKTFEGIAAAMAEQWGKYIKGVKCNEHQNNNISYQ